MRPATNHTGGGWRRIQVTVGLYRVLDLSDKQKQFKVDMNAQQNNLTGGVLQCLGGPEDVNVTLVVVEGGPKVALTLVCPVPALLRSPLLRFLVPRPHLPAFWPSYAAGH